MQYSFWLPRVEICYYNSNCHHKQPVYPTGKLNTSSLPHDVTKCFNAKLETTKALLFTDKITNNSLMFYILAFGDLLLIVIFNLVKWLYKKLQVDDLTSLASIFKEKN